MSTLSGGNQQKTVLAKWLSTEPDLLVLDEPTAAVDVGAKSVIHRALRDGAHRRATLVISSDLDEISKVCDRVLVLRRGRVVRELCGGQITLDALTRAAFGAEIRIAS
jgi:ABC-type sugar transport system ATPase subunit